MKCSVSWIVVLSILHHQLAAQNMNEPYVIDQATQFTQWMKENMSLTEDQSKSVFDISVKYFSKVDSIKMSSEDQYAKFQQLNKEEMVKDNQLKLILSEDQFKKYERQKNSLPSNQRE